MGPYCERKMLFTLDLVCRGPRDEIRFFGLFMALVYLNSEPFSVLFIPGSLYRGLQVALLSPVNVTIILQG